MDAPPVGAAFQRGKRTLVRESQGVNVMTRTEKFIPSTSRSWNKSSKKRLNKRDRQAARKLEKEE
jgi:hypothetical protein